MVSPQIVLAQDYVWRGVLWAVFGELPAPCVNLEDPLCWECMVVGKVLPLAFFMGIGTIMMSFFVTKTVKTEKNGGTQKASLLMVVVAISILLLHLLPGNELIKIFVWIYRVWYVVMFMIIVAGALYVVAPRWVGLIALIFLLWLFIRLLAPEAPGETETLISTCFP